MTLFSSIVALLTPIREILAIMLVSLMWLIPLRIFLGFFERKLTADFQARIGPNNGLFAGGFQTAFDFLRILQKEVGQGIPWGGVICFSLGFSSTLTSLYALTNPEVEIDFLLPFTLQILGVSLGAVTMRDQWIDGVRRCALMTVGVVPVLLSILCVGLKSGDGTYRELSASQGLGPLQWNLFTNPFLFLASITFFLGGYQLFVLQTQQDSGWIPSFSSRGKKYMGGGTGGDLQLLEEMVLFLSRINLAIWFVLLFLGGWQELSLPIASWLFFTLKVVFVYLLMRFFGVIGSEQKTLQRLNLSWRFTFLLGFFCLIGQVIWRWVEVS